ncbi:hypothetical protein LY76DRAFT_268107 [Colletotrichum caudatum]|nr:hypothetical protein LY76DRAFT_268107 [Colletotrichum caudatum]
MVKWIRPWGSFIHLSAGEPSRCGAVHLAGYMDSFLLPCILLVAQSVISRTTELCQSDPGKCTRALVDREGVWLLFLGLGYPSPACLLHTTFLVRSDQSTSHSHSLIQHLRTHSPQSPGQTPWGRYVSIAYTTLGTLGRQFNPPACLYSQRTHYLLLCIRTSYVQYIEQSAYLVVGR